MHEEESSDGLDDLVIETESPFIKVLPDRVCLTSPTFGDTITILKPRIKFGSSKNALKDLIHVEQQIAAMGVLPDFGYAEDNYILEQNG